MGRFTDLRTLVAIAECGSISAAAQRIGTTKSVVSKRLTELEARLGSGLAHRNPRGLTLTEPGDRLYRRALALLAELGDAEDEVRAGRTEASGVIRIAAPVTFGTMHLTQALIDFSAAHPKVQFDVDLDDQMVDLVSGGYDLAIRIGKLPDSSLIARKVAGSEHIMCASPGYVHRHEPLTHPSELKQRACLLYSNRDPNPAWTLAISGKSRSFPVGVAMRSNNGEVLRDAALAGTGIALLPNFIASPHLQSGELVPLLSDFPHPEGWISAVYSPSHHMSTNLRLFIDFLFKRGVSTSA